MLKHDSRPSRGHGAHVFQGHAPEEVIAYTSYCTHLFCKIVLQTILGTGMGMNVAAQLP